MIKDRMKVVEKNAFTCIVSEFYLKSNPEFLFHSCVRFAMYPNDTYWHNQQLTKMYLFISMSLYLLIFAAGPFCWLKYTRYMVSGNRVAKMVDYCGGPLLPIKQTSTEGVIKLRFVGASRF